jgi:hypothetical protein
LGHRQTYIAMTRDYQPARRFIGTIMRNNGPIKSFFSRLTTVGETPALDLWMDANITGLMSAIGQPAAHQ